MSDLPEEIIEENILTRLPVKSIARFRCVSKNWRLLFQNPNFIKNHLRHANLINKFNILVSYCDTDSIPRLYRVDNSVLSSKPSRSPFLGHARKIDVPYMSEKARILGSSNGLICIQPSPYFACIWNPATRENKEVPRYNEDYFTVYAFGSFDSWTNVDLEFNDDYFGAYGFGFDCKNDDYKVLRILDSEAWLYSLASNSWKNLGVVPYSFPSSANGGLLHNGVLHWILPGLESTVIVCFDISDETFHHVPLPCEISAKELSLSTLGIWEGKLCVLRRNHMEDPDICTHQNDHIDVWTMIDNQWSKPLKITAQITDMSYQKPLQTLQNGEILFKGGPVGESRIGLMSYDPILERARALKIHRCPDNSDVEAYIETLVSPDYRTSVAVAKRVTRN